jgi:hypothetical protein
LLLDCWSGPGSSCYWNSADFINTTKTRRLFDLGFNFLPERAWRGM